MLAQRSERNGKKMKKKCVALKEALRTYKAGNSVLKNANYIVASMWCACLGPGFKKVADQIEELQIPGEAITKLTFRDLSELGLNPLMRRRFLHEVSKMKPESGKPPKQGPGRMNNDFSLEDFREEIYEKLDENTSELTKEIAELKEMVKSLTSSLAQGANHARAEGVQASSAVPEGFDAASEPARSVQENAQGPRYSTPILEEIEAGESAAVASEESKDHKQKKKKKKKKKGKKKVEKESVPGAAPESDRLSDSGSIDFEECLHIDFDMKSDISHPSYHGVRWDDRNREYLAFVKIPNSEEEIRLGFFQEAVMAAQVYDKNARDLLGPGVPLNFPDQFDPSCLIRRAMPNPPGAPSTICDFPPLGMPAPRKPKPKRPKIDANARMRAIPLRASRSNLPPKKIQKPRLNNLQQKPNQGWADWRSEVLLEQLEQLSRSSDVNGLVDLNQLNSKLRNLHIRLNIDKETMVKVIKKKGICLRNCVQYGNDLEEVLSQNWRLRINPEKVQHLEYVRQCLVMLPKKAARLNNVIFRSQQHHYYSR